jgi:regulation of enolase protein 1 (concanavalin A-like superfamily)
MVRYEEKKVNGETIRIQLPITYENVRDQIMLFRVNDRKWLDADIEKLPELLALIFSLWTLLKSEHFERERER